MHAPLRLLPLALALLPLRQETQPDLGFTTIEVRFEYDGIPLAASLLLPEGEGPFPGAVILQGSGTSSRANGWAAAIAESMAARGIAVLFPDKRGSGASGGDWRTADYEDLAEDALAGFDELAARAEVGPVGLVGLSQGGQVVPFAAYLGGDRVAFVVDVSGAATTATEQVDHEMRNTFRAAGLDEGGVAQGMELQRLAGRVVRHGEWEVYDSARRAALSGPLAEVATSFPAERDSWVWGFWRRIGDEDPMVHWRRLRQPGLAVYGAEDERDNVPVRASVERLEAARANGAPIDVHVFAGAGHALFDPEAAEARLLPAFEELLASWIHTAAGG